MRTHCPACGEPLEDDGDRIYDDSCAYCDWATADRRAADRLNAAIFGHMRAAEVLAQTLHDVQTTYDRECEYDPEANEKSWEELDAGVRSMYIDIASKAIVSREDTMRERLIQLRTGRKS